MAKTSPHISDLYHLANQLKQDQDLPLEQLRQRDRDIGLACSAGGSAWQRLHCWLGAVDPDAIHRPAWARSASSLLLLNLLALLGGFGAMAGVLLGSVNALVNVLFWLLLFVGLQWLLMAGSVLVLIQLLRGRVPRASPIDPARWVLHRRWPDVRTLREAQPLLQLLFLRHGQVLGALFAGGAALAFIVLPAVDHYGFVWGSTYQLSDGFMHSLVETLAWPWESFLPGATVAPEVVSSSRYHAGVQVLEARRLEDMSGWWEFLLLVLLVYSLFPRMLLWGVSRWLYRRQLAASLLDYPGVERVLARMQVPLVSTSGAAAELQPVSGNRAFQVPSSETPLTLWPRALLVEVAAAFGENPLASFEELADGQPGLRAQLAGADLATDRQVLVDLPRDDIDRLYLAVKGWEPPVAELADLLEPLFDVPHCSLLLVPLPGRPLPQHKIEDWRAFARALPFQGVDVQALKPVRP